MSKENLEQFMTEVADGKELQAKIGKEITGDALVASGAAHGCEFSIGDVQVSVGRSDAQLEGVSGGRQTEREGPGSGYWDNNNLPRPEAIAPDLVSATSGTVYRVNIKKAHY